VASRSPLGEDGKAGALAPPPRVFGRCSLAQDALETQAIKMMKRIFLISFDNSSTGCKIQTSKKM
jgi:hypothetical protein